MPLASPQVRMLALDLANSPAWQLLVRPEIDRQLLKYEDTLLNSAVATDRELADTRTRYHALQDLLKALHAQVQSSLSTISFEDSTSLTPEVQTKLHAVFHPSPKPAPAAPLAPPPIPFPPTPTFNPFGSPPPPEDKAEQGLPPSASSSSGSETTVNA